MEIKQKKGISLIVLVITIIVMIILAAAIILSLNSSGIIGKANDAKNKSDMANAKQVVILAQTEWQLDQEKIKQEDTSITSFKDYAKKKLNEAGYVTTGSGGIEVSNTGAVNKIYVDSEGKQAIIPEGFVASSATGENTIENGLVIYEGNEKVTNDNVEEARETRNQFVWIPVENITKFERTTVYDGETISNPGNEFSEPYDQLSLENDLTGEWAEWTAMRASVEEYHGFYIGRYEAGTEIKSTGYSPITNVLIQKNKYACSCVPWGTSLTEIGTSGAVYLSRSLYNTESVRSTLCYGVQWDAALNFIATSGVKDEDFATTGGIGYIPLKNYDSYDATPIKTGSIEDYGLNNIYDMYGNVGEWTMEYEYDEYGDPWRVFRGDDSAWFENSTGAGCRSGFPIDSWQGFRPTLYLK